MRCDAVRTEEKVQRCTEDCTVQVKPRLLQRNAGGDTAPLAKIISETSVVFSLLLCNQECSGISLIND